MSYSNIQVVDHVILASLNYDMIILKSTGFISLLFVICCCCKIVKEHSKLNLIFHFVLWKYIPNHGMGDYINFIMPRFKFLLLKFHISNRFLKNSSKKQTNKKTIWEPSSGQKNICKYNHLLNVPSSKENISTSLSVIKMHVLIISWYHYYIKLLFSSLGKHMFIQTT